MTFLWPDMLGLLLAAPLLVGAYIYVLRRRRKAAVNVPHLATIKLAMSGRTRWRRHVPPALLLVSFCLLVLAMARPTAVVTLASQGGTIIMAMDVSGSMRAADVMPDRISAAQVAAKDFVDHRAKPIKVGVVGFSGAAFLVQPPTTDTDALDRAIEGLRPQFTTAIGSAVVTSLQTIFPQVQVSGMIQGFGGEQFTSSNPNDMSHPAAKPAPPPAPVEPGTYRSAAIVLMTDGRNTNGPDPLDAARIAANMGVRIFTIGFGTANGQMLSFYGRSIKAMLDEPTLKTMATMTKGQYFHATSSQELTKIYQLLTTKLQTEKQEAEISAFFVAAAVGFFLAATLLSLFWFRQLF